MFKGEPVALLTDTQGYEHESLILPVCLNPNLLFNRFFLSGKGGYPPPIIYKEMKKQCISDTTVHCSEKFSGQKGSCF